MVFDRRVNDSVLTFGVSGLLYQSDVLMFDRETESLWSQLGQHAINGAHQNQKLTWLPSLHMSWSEWKSRFPNSVELSPETGYHRNYDGSAYADYFAFESTMFPVPIERRELPIKSWVIGVLLKKNTPAD